MFQWTLPILWGPGNEVEARLLTQTAGPTLRSQLSRARGQAPTSAEDPKTRVAGASFTDSERGHAEPGQPWSGGIPLDGHSPEPGPRPSRPAEASVPGLVCLCSHLEDR